MEEEIKKIWNAKLDERIKLEHNEYLFEFRVDQSFDRTEYSWVAYRKARLSDPVFPLTNSNLVTFFKTMKGAKRNFLKRFYPKELVAKITQAPAGVVELGLNGSSADSPKVSCGKPIV